MGEKIPDDHVLRNMVLAVISTTESVDKANSWTAGGVAAAIALILANINGFSQEFSESNIKCILLLLLVALIMGMFSKLIHVRIKQAVDINNQANEYLSNNIDNINMEALKHALDFITNKAPRWYQKSFVKKVTREDAIKNHYFLLNLSKKFNRQNEFFYAMLFFATLAVIYAIYVI